MEIGKSFALLIFMSAASLAAAQNAGSTASKTPPKTAMTAAEKNFFGAAGSYLKTANFEAAELARKMAGASNGSSTLGEIKAAISSVMRVENAGYQGDYKGRIKGDVPSSGRAIATDIDETHRLFQAAMTEYLEYWKDQNNAHIASGQATLVRCANLMNKTIAATTAKMKTFDAK
jgi:hypothetical protein